MGIFASGAVVLMGIKLAKASVHAIANPQEPIFSAALVIVLVLSILVKIYMYSYNKRFAEITGSETLKATVADCISDSIATVSVFIMFAGIKSLWEVLGVSWERLQIKRQRKRSCR